MIRRERGGVFNLPVLGEEVGCRWVSILTVCCGARPWETSRGLLAPTPWVPGEPRVGEEPAPRLAWDTSRGGLVVAPWVPGSLRWVGLGGAVAQGDSSGESWWWAALVVVVVLDCAASASLSGSTRFFAGLPTAP